MKKISHLPITEDATDMYIDGIKPDGLDGEGNPKYKNYRVPASALGGEVWEDITSEFTASSMDFAYKLNNNDLYELIADIPLRITIELYFFDELLGGSVTGTIQVYATFTTVTPGLTISLLTNTIASGSTEFTGQLWIEYNSGITYSYGITLSEELERPKILKVERLMGVNENE